MAAKVADGQCGLTDGSSAGDWRLPTEAELTAIMDASCVDFGHPALIGKSGTGCYATDPWTSPFVAIGSLWTSTSLPDSTSTVAASVNLLDNGHVPIFKSGGSYFWLVRAGQ
jgi:hypothetical protein